MIILNLHLLPGKEKARLFMSTQTLNIMKLHCLLHLAFKCWRMLALIFSVTTFLVTQIIALKAMVTLASKDHYTVNFGSMVRAKVYTQTFPI